MPSSNAGVFSTPCHGHHLVARLVRRTPFTFTNDPWVQYANLLFGIQRYLKKARPKTFTVAKNPGKKMMEAIDLC